MAEKSKFKSFRTPKDFFYNYIFRKNVNNKGLPSGEILLYHWKELLNKISIYDKTTENIIWVKLQNHYLHSDENIYIACVYNNPTN